MLLNDELADLSARHQVYLTRYSASVIRKIIALLNDVDDDLAAQILKRDPTAVNGAWSAKRLEALLKAVRDINRDAYRLIEKTLSRELKELALYEAGFQTRSLQRALPVAFDVVAPSVEQIGAAVLARPFQGRLLKEWVKGLEGASYDRLRAAIRLGFIEGESITQILKRITGTAALKYKDGVAFVAKRHAATVVRTAVNHTANFARDELYKANNDLIKGVQWVSTLDGRTSAICRARDGKVYPVDSGPRPPAHSNCRSATAPITKSWRELGIDADELPPGTRASMNGQVSATETYGTWLKRQPKAFQDDVLGPSKAALFRSGGLKLDKFVDHSGKELTLDQLKSTQAGAFEKSGLSNSVRPPRGSPQDAIADFLADTSAQQELLSEAMPLYGSHRKFVADVIENKGWSAAIEPVLSVRHYTGSAYREWNARLRDGSASLTDRRLTALASQGLDEMPAYRGAIWRAPVKTSFAGNRMWNRAVIGEELDVGLQFQSYSAREQFARMWADDSRVIIHVKSSPHGAKIDTISQHPLENEVLLPPGLRYRVVGKRIDGDMRIIEVEVLANG